MYDENKWNEVNNENEKKKRRALERTSGSAPSSISDFR